MEQPAPPRRPESRWTLSRWALVVGVVLGALFVLLLIDEATNLECIGQGIEYLGTEDCGR